MATPLASQVFTKSLSGYAYSVEPLGFRDGRNAFLRLTKLLGPVLTHLDTKGAKANTEAAWAVFFSGLGELLQSLSPEDLDYFEGLYKSRSIVKTPEGKILALKDEGVMDNLFSGPRFGHYFFWLGVAIWGTYGDFFTESFGRLGDLLPAPVTAKA
jgi:hypothetical protein